ncbi:MAG: glycosyltransferase family 2 protein [Vicinamibacterales bacterium]
MTRLAVVIPVYQAAQTLDPLLAELLPALSRLTPDFDVLLVDDGSTDASWTLIEQASARDGRVRGLRLIRNFGEHVAITAGIDHVDADHIVIMACDLQDDPAALEQMMQQATEGAELVLVRRMARQDAWSKRLLARLFYAMISLFFHVHYDYRVGNFRLLSRDAASYFRQHRERARNVNAIMALMDVRTGYVDVRHRPRRHGNSTYTLHRSALMAASVVLGYSQMPLLVSGAVGGVLCLASLACGAALGVRAWTGGTVSSTALILSGVGAVGGFVLVNLGIVGVYLGRAAIEAKDRPMYFVDARVGGSDRIKGS